MVHERHIPETGIPQASWLSKKLDQFACALSPRWGARRAAQRLALSRLDNYVRDRLGSGGWTSTKEPQKEKSWLTSRLSPDAEAEQQLSDLQDASLSLFKTNTFAHGIVQGRCTNEVGIGLRPQGRVRETPNAITADQARGMNARMEDLFTDWDQDGVDATGTLNLTAVQRQVNRTLSIFGEAFIFHRNDPTKNSILPVRLDTFSPRQVETPPDMLMNPLVRMGVRFNEKGLIVGYYVRRQEEGDLHQVNEPEYDYLPRYDRAGNVLVSHIKDPLFSNQTRGFPWLAASQRRFKELGDYVEATLIAAEIESCFTVFIKTLGSSTEIARRNATQQLDGGRRVEDIYPGMIQYLEADEDVEFGSPTRPGSSFAPFMEFGIRSLATASDYPFELLAKNFTGVTYSSGRLSLLDGRAGFLGRRSLMVDQWLRHLWHYGIYRSLFLGQLDEFVSVDTFLSQPWAYRRHRWGGQGWHSMDPLKETKAHVEGIDNDIEAVSESLEERGMDFDEHLERREHEKMRLAEQDVRVRAHKWQLEEAAGLPHDGEQEETDETDGANNEPAAAGA